MREQKIGGVAGWLLGRLRGQARKRARLELVERITLGPRQSLALIETEGRSILVATSAEGAPVFFPLDRVRTARTVAPVRAQMRTSW